MGPSSHNKRQRLMNSHRDLRPSSKSRSSNPAALAAENKRRAEEAARAAAAVRALWEE